MRPQPHRTLEVAGAAELEAVVVVAEHRRVLSELPVYPDTFLSTKTKLMTQMKLSAESQRPRQVILHGEGRPVRSNCISERPNLRSLRVITNFRLPVVHR